MDENRMDDEELLNLPPDEVSIDNEEPEPGEERETDKSNLPPDEVPDAVTFEVEEETAPEPVLPMPKPKLHLKAKTPNQIKREILSAQYRIKQRDSEIDELRRENERLKMISEQSSQAAITHYDDAIKLRAQQAEHNLKLAIENSDADAHLEASKELARAISDEREVQRWKSQQEFERKNAPVAEPERYAEEVVPRMTPAAEEWFSLNPWAMEGNQEYDPELASVAESCAIDLNNRYVREGRPDLRWSPSYYAELNKTINHEMSRQEGSYADEHAQPRIEPVMVRKPVMNKARPPVAPINRGGSNSSSKSSMEISNPIEREYVNNLKQAGVIKSDAEWRAWQKYDDKFVAVKGDRGRR